MELLQRKEMQLNGIATEGGNASKWNSYRKKKDN
jgi:hypothetical protein